MRGRANERLSWRKTAISSARAAVPGAHFEQQDLSRLILSCNFDGISCSFLRPGAWICLIDIDDLLGHEPCSDTTRNTLECFYEEALERRRYDFRVGRKLAAALEQQGFEVRTSTLHDSELAFDGPATPEVLDALEFGRLLFHTLESPAHQSVCRVICSVGRRTLTA